MKKLTKLVSLVTGLAMAASLVGCGASTSADTTSSAPAADSAQTSTTADSTTTADTAATTFGIEPMAEATTLNLGFFAGSPLSYPFLFADKEGFFKELNITINYESFTNGNAMMEANNDWDMAGCGEGGLLAGMLGYDVHVIGISDYEHNIALFARKDSPLAQDPTNPDNWKGTTWLGPVGTTAQAVLVAGLGNVGLSLSDVNCTNMDISSALTAFLGGEGDGLMVWNAVAFSAEDAGCVRIGDSQTLNVTCPCATLATTTALEEKPELIAKAYAVFYKTVEWMYADQANFDKCVQYYFDDCEDQGIKCDESVAERVMKYYAPPKTLEESVKLFTDTSKDDAGKYTTRDLLQAEKDILVGMDFFISQGKYTEDQRNTILDGGLVDSSVALAAAKLFQ